METNITYNFDAFEKASEIMRQSVINLSEKNARQQIAAMAMQSMFSNIRYTRLYNIKEIAQLAIIATDTLIAELNKKKDESK